MKKEEKENNKTHTNSAEMQYDRSSIQLDKNLQRKIHVHPISLPSPSFHSRPDFTSLYLDPLRILDLCFREE